ncbi:MAG: hypothetical protein IZT58_14040 [Actinobacteria bacterium]|nr:hypothetical protein [Actinomycetota bacterium]
MPLDSAACNPQSDGARRRTTSAQVGRPVFASGIENRSRMVVALCGASSEHKPAQFAGTAARIGSFAVVIIEWVRSAHRRSDVPYLSGALAAERSVNIAQF